MAYTQDLAGTRYTFADLRALLAAASPQRSGDEAGGRRGGLGRRAHRGALLRWPTCRSRHSSPRRWCPTRRTR